MFNVND